MRAANKQRITKELCENNILLFYPSTEEEAVFIEQQVISLGYQWAKDEASDHGKAMQESVATGMVLKFGDLYWSPSKTSTRDGLLCTIAQFDKEYIPLEQKFLLEQFNKLSARIEEIGAKVDMIYQELHPQPLDKPVLSPKK